MRLRELARRKAQAELERMASPAHPLRLVDEQDVADVGWGLVYAWNTVRYFETRDEQHATGPGAGPIVVLKATLHAFALESSPAPNEQLAAYAREHELGATIPLAWG